MIYHTIRDPILKYDVSLAICGADEFIKFLKEDFNIEITIEDYEYGRFIKQERIVWLREFKNTPEYIGELTHECFHACMCIMDQKGIVDDPPYFETNAYHLEWMMKEFLLLLKK